MAYGGGAAVAAYAAIAQAIKASGAIVQVKSEVFVKLVSRVEKPLVVTATGGTFKKNYQYLTAYKGLIFYTRAAEPLMLPGGAEVIAAGKIWIPV